MRAAWVVFIKELLDSIRDRRSVFSALLFPLLGPVLVASTMSVTVNRIASDEAVELPVAGAEHAPALMEHLRREGVDAVPPPVDPAGAIRDHDVDAVLVIPPGFGAAFRDTAPAGVILYSDASRADASRTLRRTRAALESYSSRVGSMRLLARGVSPVVARPIQIQEVQLATPEKLAARVLSMIPAFLLMTAFVAGMYVSTDATAGERERGSLEPLLLNPVRPLWMVAGKWAAAFAFAALGVVLTLVGMLAALSRVPLEQLGVSLWVGPAEAFAMLAVAIPLCAQAAALQLFVATFARSFREAQTYLSLLVLAPTVPLILSLAMPMAPQWWMTIVPMWGPHILIDAVLRAEPPALWWFLVNAAFNVATTVAAIAVTARLLRHERIVFSR